jgi:hypothetical protein
MFPTLTLPAPDRGPGGPARHARPAPARIGRRVTKDIPMVDMAAVDRTGR